jgi:uncharacterized protein (TIGR02118 family)
MRTLALIARHPDLDRESFRSHYEQTHVPLALPLLGGLTRYVRNHLVSTLFGEPPGFDDREAFESGLARLSGPSGQAVAEDENRFMDKPRNVFFGVHERAGTGLEDPPGTEKWALLLKARPDGVREGRMDSFEGLLQDTFAGAPGWRLFDTRKIGAEPPVEAVAFVWLEPGNVDVERLPEWALILGQGGHALRVDACSSTDPLR